jgi:hypothetical protein
MIRTLWILLAGGVIAAGLTAPLATAERFTICPSGNTGVTTPDTSCDFAENVRRAYYSQRGPIVDAYSRVTNQWIEMQCSATPTSFWRAAKRCVGLNSSGIGLIVYVS